MPARDINLPPWAERSTDARRTQILQTAKRIIHERYAEHLSLNTIAEAMRLSPYHLSHIFSEHSGFTLSSYLTSVRMEKAADLLRASQDSVADIAAAVGFNDAHYFGKVFRAHFGHTPSQFRARK